MRKRTLPLTPVLTSAALLAVGLPTTATAHDVELGSGTSDTAISIFRNRATKRCLEDSGAGLRAHPCNGLNFQQWQVTVDRTLRNVNTGRCLDDGDAGLRALPCDGLDSQKWNVTRRSDGVVLANHQTKRCVEDSGHGLRSYACDGLSFQRWY